jgi:hypothetical protein
MRDNRLAAVGLATIAGLVAVSGLSGPSAAQARTLTQVADIGAPTGRECGGSAVIGAKPVASAGRAAVADEVRKLRDVGQVRDSEP